MLRISRDPHLSGTSRAAVAFPKRANVTFVIGLEHVFAGKHVRYVDHVER